jgi:DNA repair protein RadC
VLRREPGSDRSAWPSANTFSASKRVGFASGTFFLVSASANRSAASVASGLVRSGPAGCRPPPAQHRDATRAIPGARLAVQARMTEPEMLDRPRERLMRRGAPAIADVELLAILLGTGVRAHPAAEVARELLVSSGGMGSLSRASPHELARVLGIGVARAARVAAAFELGRRAFEVEHHRESLGEAEDVYRVLAPRLAGLQQEVFVAIGVDIRNGLLEVVEVARGTVTSVDVHPREVFRPMLRMAAAGCVLAHNHPSGDPTPSFEDIELTHRMRAVGDLVGIPVVDHVVIGERKFISIREWLGATDSAK